MSTTTRTTSKGRTRPTPQRTCASCRRLGNQSSFVRLVRVTDEAGARVEVDEGRRRVAGRGTYLCRDANCWERGLKGSLSGSLRIPLDAANREALRAYATHTLGLGSEDTDGSPAHGPDAEDDAEDA